MTKFISEMKLSRKLLARLTRRRGRTDLERWSGLHSAEQMRRVIERERTRADRTGEGVSLLVLASDDAMSANVVMARAAQAFKRQLRTLDDAGWLDAHRLGVVLPATPPSGAWRVADDLRTDPQFAVLPLRYTVYHYPSDSWPAGESMVEQESIGMPPAPMAEPMESLFVRNPPTWKRSIDIVGATTALLLATPLLFTAALAIKVFSPGPVFFRQWRSGRGGVPFRMVKLRTMVVDAERKKSQLMSQNEQDGPAFKIRRDPRVTAVGWLLRRTSIDELPQFWNVLKGEMSLVGPRPLPCSEAAACSPWQRRRLDVTPGLTCTWQVEGRSRVSFAEWVRMDIQYIGGSSLTSDVKLLLRTLPALVFCAGR